MDANFGQDPFKFDIEGEMMEHRSKVGRQIEGFPTPGRHGDWQCLLHQMVSSYLVHHGFRLDLANDAISIDCSEMINFFNSAPPPRLSIGAQARR